MENLELKSAIPEIKILLNALNIILDPAWERVSKLKDSSTEMIQTEI